MPSRTIFLFFLLAELTSYAGYFFPWLHAVGFALITGAALMLSMRKLEYGLMFALTDLILGGKSGALFSFQSAGFFLSLRMALFIIVMAVWGGKVIAAKMHSPSRPPSPDLASARSPSPLGREESEGILKWWGVFGAAVVWGIAVGFVRHRNFGDLFLDANGYFYAALILPVVWSMPRMDTNQRREWMRIYGALFFTATTWVAIKTLLSVFIFTHAGNNFIAANLISFYRWVRDTGVGEITWLPGNFARVFFQSHIYNVMAFFVLITWFITPPTSPYLKGRKLSLAFLALNTAVIIVSFSRSFWVGTAAGLFVLIVAAAFRLPWRPKGCRYILQLGSTVGMAFLISIFFIILVARFPFPRPSGADLSSAINARLQNEEASSSRWNLLPPLWRAIKAHPIVGSGFGATVSYISNDPRIRAESPTGSYTTYAFEWGWLDIWLKFGLVGLIALAGLIIVLMRALYSRIEQNRFFVANIASLAGLVAINIFTPYLNHPLGIGVLIISTGLALTPPLPSRDSS